MPLIEVHEIEKVYQLGEVAVPALRGVSLTIQRGEFVALMGPSGSGKTTLMNLLGCLDHPTAGRYLLDGHDVTQLTTEQLAALRCSFIGFVFQNFNLLARTDSLDNVAMPTFYRPDPAAERDVRDRCGALLEMVGLADRKDHQPNQLSGGQQQRVAIARALANEPLVLLADEPTGNLDSKTSDEILQMFRDLNESHGITIILVTHDPTVGDRANRVIKLSDGLVESDVSKAPTSSNAPARSDERTVSVHQRKDSLLDLRAAANTLRIAVKALMRNMLRSALTMLGIVIGIAAVIAMMEISQGASSAIRSTITRMGANTLLVMPGAASRTGVRMSGGVNTLTPEDGLAIVNECPSVHIAAPVVKLPRMQIVYGSRNWTSQNAIGSTPAFLEARDWSDLAAGEPFADDDVRSSRRVCLIGQTLVRELFDSEDPLGREVRVGNVPLEVVGVLPAKGANLLGVDQDDILLTPWTTLKNRVMGGRAAPDEFGGGRDPRRDSNGKAPPPESVYPEKTPAQLVNTPMSVRLDSVNQILVRAVSAEAVDNAMSEIDELLLLRHRIDADEERDFRVRDMAEVSDAFNRTVRLLSGLLLSVALIALIVGGVGIMNIMLVSVTERTREVGLRMAVGASPRTILRQFLVEAVVLCLLGGIVGILVGRGAAICVQVLLNWPTEPSLIAVIVAVSVAVTVGLTFGYYPAWKASRLDPIDALRFE